MALISYFFEWHNSLVDILKVSLSASHHLADTHAVLLQDSDTKIVRLLLVNKLLVLTQVMTWDDTYDL